MDKSRYSKASKERWAKLTPEQRTERMRSLAMARWSKATPKDRQVQYKKMVAAKLAK